MDLRCKSISFSSLIDLLVWKDIIYEAWVLGNCGLSVPLTKVGNDKSILTYEEKSSGQWDH